MCLCTEVAVQVEGGLDRGSQSQRWVAELGPSNGRSILYGHMSQLGVEHLSMALVTKYLNCPVKLIILKLILY